MNPDVGNMKNITLEEAMRLYPQDLLRNATDAEMARVYGDAMKPDPRFWPKRWDKRT